VDTAASKMKVRWRVLNHRANRCHGHAATTLAAIGPICASNVDLVAIALPLLQIDTHGESAWDMLPAAAMPE